MSPLGSALSALGAIVLAVAVLAAATLEPDGTAVGDAQAQEAASAGVAFNVRVVTPQMAPSAPTLRLPGIARAAEEATLHARINGFVRERRVDLGDRVTAGQLLAVIDAPEIDHQLRRAEAQVRQAEAAVRLAAATLERARTLVAQGHVSRQVFDEREAEWQVRTADLAAAQAEARRLQQLQSFQRVTAPFDGWVVARNIERGNLVEGDSPEAGTFLFRIARLEMLRMDVDVPQGNVAVIGGGTPAEVTFAEFPGRRFEARVVRTARQIDGQSRTMRVELAMPNPDAIVPAGMLGQVTFLLPAGPAVALLPLNTVVIRPEGPRVAVVGAEGSVRFAPVRLGRDLGAQVEVLDGVDAADRVVVNPNGLLRDGDQVAVGG